MSTLLRYINELKSASVSKKIMIIKILSTSKQEKVREILLECLNDPSPGVRIAALQALERLNYFNEELMLKLCNDSSKAIRKVALKILSANPKSEYLNKLNGLLIDSDKTVRLEMVNFLYKVGKEALPILRRALKDEEELIRTKARYYIQLLEPDEKNLSEEDEAYLDKVPSGFFEPRILPVVDERIKNKTVHYEQKLGKITIELDRRGVNAFEYLLSLLEDRSWTIREFAVKKLSELQEINNKKIYELLKHPIWYVRASAVRILGLRKDESIIDLLVPLLNDGNAEVRRAIAEAIGRIKKENAIVLLQHLLNDKNIMVKREAEKSLAAYKKEN